MPSSGEEKNELLKTLVGLHVQGLSQHTDLPRVVLLGSSDSAKQTAIMALTGLPLPKEYLGNEFTMEFILIPSKRTSIKMSIIPAYRGCIDEEVFIPALEDEVGDEDSDGDALFEFLLGRLILQLREFGEDSLTIKDVIRVEIQRPCPGSMVILDLPQWSDRNASDRFVHQLTKSRNTILVAHDDISTLKSSKLSRLLEKRKNSRDGGNRTMAVFVAYAAYLTT